MHICDGAAPDPGAHLGGDKRAVRNPVPVLKIDMSISARETGKQLMPLIEQVNDDRVAIEITFATRECGADLCRRVRRAR
jgi:hypothetical protein